jgi:hypothetical protein
LEGDCYRAVLTGPEVEFDLRRGETGRLQIEPQKPFGQAAHFERAVGRAVNEAAHLRVATVEIAVCRHYQSSGRRTPRRDHAPGHR